MSISPRHRYVLDQIARKRGQPIVMDGLKLSRRAEITLDQLFDQEMTPAERDMRVSNVMFSTCLSTAKEADAIGQLNATLEAIRREVSDFLSTGGRP